MKIVIIGSFRKYYKEILDASILFAKKGHAVLFPKSSTPLQANAEFVLLENDQAILVKDIEDGLLRKIDECDLVYLVNPNGYVGKSAVFEMGYATALGKPIYSLAVPEDATLPHYITAVMTPEQTNPIEGSKDHFVSANQGHLIFDADDTLWESQGILQEAEQKVERLLDKKMGGNSHFQSNFIKTEVENIPHMGLGTHSYFFSLAETFYIQPKHHQYKKEFIEICSRLAQDYLDSPPQVYGGVKETLSHLRQKKYKTHLLSRGVQSEQMHKLRLSGLVEFFDSITICKSKTVHEYKNLIERIHANPEKTYMIGNSLKSDIKPALQAGLWVVHIPCSVEWSLEQESFDESVPRYFKIENFSGLTKIFSGD